MIILLSIFSRTPPYHNLYDHKVEIDDSKQIVIQMPRQQIMTMGFGQQVKLTDFPVIENFLDGDYDLPIGTHTLKSVIDRLSLKKETYKISPSFYPFGGLSGNAMPMYIYGTTGFTLKPDRTTLTVALNSYSVRGYIFLTDDQWDYDSQSPFASVFNPILRVIGGPSHNNLHKGGILIQYTGMGTYEQVNQR